MPGAPDVETLGPRGSTRIAPELVAAYVAAYAYERSARPESVDSSPVRERDLAAVLSAADELGTFAGHLRGGGVASLPAATQGFHGSPSSAGQLGTLALHALGKTAFSRPGRDGANPTEMAEALEGLVRSLTGLAAGQVEEAPRVAALFSKMAELSTGVYD